MNNIQDIFVFITEASFPFIARIFVTFLTIKHFGFIRGIILTYLILKLYTLLITKIFKVEKVTGIDKTFLDKNFHKRYQIVSLMSFSNFNAEKISNFILETHINKLHRFRLKLTKIFFEYWWTEVDVAEAKNKMKIYPRIKTEKELMEYVSKELNTPLDVMHELPYEFHIIPFGEEKDNKGYILFKYDHLLTDGLGLVSTICSCATNYDINNFPSIMRNMKEDKWYETIINWIFYPYYTIYYSLWFLLQRPRVSAFKPTKPYGKTLIAKSTKEYSLKAFEGFRKGKVMSFNDLMVLVFSLASKKLIKQVETCKHKDKMRFMIPHGRKELPKDLEHVDLDNKANGLFVEIPLIDEITDRNIKIIKSSIRRNFKKPIQFAYLQSLYILGEYFSWPIQSFCAQMISDNYEIAFSNVPGPTVQLNYNGAICDSMVSFPTSGRGFSFLPLVSYNGNFQMALSMDESCPIKPEMFIRYIEDELDLILIDIQNGKYSTNNEQSSNKKNV